MNSINNSSLYWTRMGIPVSSTGTKMGEARWDGSRFVQSSSPSLTEDASYYNPYYSDSKSGFTGPGSSFGSNTNSFGSTGGVNGFGFGTPGFGGAFSDSAVAGIGQQGAVSGLTNAAVNSAVNSALNGAVVGGITGSIEQGISSAVSGFASPGSLAGMVGGLVNGALGVDVQGPTSMALGALSGIASLASPALGLAVGVFGPAIADLSMDALDARTNERTKDFAEDLTDSFVGGRLAGTHLSNAINNRGMNLNTVSLASPVSQALGQLGINNNIGLTQEALANAYADLGFAPDVANVSAYADVVGMGIDSVTDPSFGLSEAFGGTPANSSFGNVTGSFDISPSMNESLADTYGSLGLGKGFGQVDTTTQGPAATPGSSLSGQTKDTTPGPNSSPGTPSGTPDDGTPSGNNNNGNPDNGETGNNNGTEGGGTDGGGEGTGGGGTGDGHGAQGGGNHGDTAGGSFGGGPGGGAGDTDGDGDSDSDSDAD